jgi:hypothetical protein
VSSADITPDANDRIHYVADMLNLSLKVPLLAKNTPIAKLKMIAQTSETIVSEFNNFDYIQ